MRYCCFENGFTNHELLLFKNKQSTRRTASGAAGNGFGTTIKYLRRTWNGAAGNGLGTTAKYTAAGNRLASLV
jgi:hypothetical protein